MGGGGDTPQKTMQTSQQNGNSTTGPNPYIVPQLQQLADGASGWMDSNMTAPGYFPNGAVAPRSPYDQSAQDAIWNTANNGINRLNDQFAPSVNYLTDTANGKYLDPSQNKEYQGWLEASFRPQAEQFRDILSPSIDSKFAGSGRTSGGAHFDTTMRGVQDLERSQSDAAAKAALGYYQGERGLQQGAATALPGVFGQQGQQAAGWLGLLQGVGQGDTAYAQRQLDDQNAKYGYDTGGQLDWYNRLSQSLIGMYPGGQTQGSSSGTSSGTGSGGGGGGGQTGQLVGSGIAAAGTIAAAFI